MFVFEPRHEVSHRSRRVELCPRRQGFDSDPPVAVKERCFEVGRYLPMPACSEDQRNVAHDEPARILQMPNERGRVCDGDGDQCPDEEASLALPFLGSEHGDQRVGGEHGSHPADEGTRPRDPSPEPDCPEDAAAQAAAEAAEPGDSTAEADERPKP